MKRRTALAAGFVVASASAGLGMALRWQFERPPAAGALVPPVPGDLWRLRFEQPGGGELALADYRGRPLLLNFWATWCPPCVAEMPLLDRFQREHAPWRIVGLALDSAPAVAEFLSRLPVGFAIALAGTEGLSLTRSLGNTLGALPFSVAFDSTGAPTARKLGPLTEAELNSWAQRVR